VTDLSAFEPNVEAVAGYEPDLVITEATNPDFLAQLDSLGLAHWDGPAPIGFSDVYAQIEQLGAVTGHVGEAAELVSQMQTDVDAIIAGMPPLEAPLSVYHELDNTYFSVTSDTFIGHVYNRLGLRNIADEAEGTGGAYPQLNAEFIISTNPDLIFLADTRCCGESAETVAARPGWDAITAVTNGGVVEMDDDVASRWGPRLVDYMQAVADAVQRVTAAQ
jgi:iron complex transport system substrate-binding protein